MDFFKDLYNGNFTLEQVLSFFKLLLLILLPFIIIHIVILTITMWKIFEKEGIKKEYALIPFYRLALLFKIIYIPSIYAYIPIMNILIVLFMPYNLAKQYGLNENKSVLAIILPYYFLPYIAFSNLKNRDKKISFEYIKYNKQIDEIEDNFNKMPDETIIIDDHDYVSIKNQKSEPLKESFVDKLNYSINDDEYVEDEELKPKEQAFKPYKKDEEEIIDLEDEDNVVSVVDIDKIDEEVKDSSDTKITVKQDIKEYKVDGPSATAIAFGGQKKEENLTEAKKDEHKCPRCGASLVGATDRCLGCGLELKNIG